MSINRKSSDPNRDHEIPGDTDAPDIVGRTGEEMPEFAHDKVDHDRMDPDELLNFEEEIVQGDVRKQPRDIAPTDPASMPRDDDHPGGVKNSPEFHDRPAPLATPTQRSERDRDDS